MAQAAVRRRLRRIIHGGPVTSAVTHPFHVCYFLKRYPRLSETFIVNELVELHRQGVVLTIVAKKPSGEAVVHEKVQSLNVPIYYLPEISAVLKQAMHVRALRGIADTPALYGVKELRGALSADDYETWLHMAMIAPWLKHQGIQHLHAHFATWATTAAAFASQLTGIPFSFTAHAKDIYHESVNPAALAEKMQTARSVITVSDFNVRYLEALLDEHRTRAHIVRVYNGIDLEQFNPDPRPQTPTHVLAVGRLIQKKGFDYLIDACRILNKQGTTFQCDIIGEGEARSRLEQRIREQGLESRVRLLGACPQGDVIEHMKRASVFVLPCVVGDDGNRDALPTVLLEAMALERPVISTNLVGIPEIIQHGKTGYLVEEKNARDLAQAIGMLLSDPSLCTALGRAARETVRRTFEISKNVQDLRQCFMARDACLVA